MRRLGRKERAKAKARVNAPLPMPVLVELVAPQFLPVTGVAAYADHDTPRAAALRQGYRLEAKLCARARPMPAKGYGMADATPILHARPLSCTPASSAVETLSMRVQSGTPKRIGSAIERGLGNNPKRFHEPLGGTMKARHVGLMVPDTLGYRLVFDGNPRHAPTKVKEPIITHRRFKRHSSPAKAPVTQAQFNTLDGRSAARQYTLASGRLLRCLAADVAAAEQFTLDAIEANRKASAKALAKSVARHLRKAEKLSRL